MFVPRFPSSKKHSYHEIATSFKRKRNREREKEKKRERKREKESHTGC